MQSMRLLLSKEPEIAPRVTQDMAQRNKQTKNLNINKSGKNLTKSDQNWLKFNTPTNLYLFSYTSVTFHRDISPIWIGSMEGYSGSIFWTHVWSWDYQE